MTTPGKTDAGAWIVPGGAKESSTDSKLTHDFSRLFSMVFYPFFSISRLNVPTVFSAFRDFFQFAGGV